ncbi:MAG: response regulator SirA [Chloroflexi bacterium]|nr:response regulator SirA [Chloroflexota bacterium]
MTKIKQIRKRSGAVVDFNPDRITNAIYRAVVSVGGRDRKSAETLSQMVVQLIDENTPTDEIPTVEEIQDTVEKVLIENGHAKVAKAFILYRDERTRNRDLGNALARHSSYYIPWKKMWYVLDWAVTHDVHTIENLNKRISKGEFPDIVTEAEAIYNQDVKNASEMIIERKDELRIVIITGPSSSGKTTTTTKVGQLLEEVGLELVTLNIDHYFFNLDMHPKDEFGDYDFETPQALDLPLINQHIKELIAGEEVQIPFYDFKTGTRHDNQTVMKLKENEIILIDSLHGLYKDMTDGIPLENQFKLYIEPLLQLKDNNDEYVRWTDIRLIRRMLRDATHRAYNPRQTLEHWHYVRSSEMRNIIPYINTTHYVINSGMPYELPLYRPKLLERFAEWVEQYQDDPLREDAYTRAARVHNVLQQITGVEDDTPVPEDSVLREFIGGSIYEY